MRGRDPFDYKMFQLLVQRASSSAGVNFEKVFRAKLHKNTKYMDELRTETLLERAARVIRACYLPGCRPEKDSGMSCEAARAILDAFGAATGGSA